MSEKLNLIQKMIEVKKLIAEEGLSKDKKGFNYTYVTGNQILGKITAKMNDIGLLLIPSSRVGHHEQYDYKNSKGKDKTDFIVKGEMSYTWINANNPEETLEIPWAYYGQQEDVSKAYGSGLTYSERYYLLKFFGVPTDEDAPEERDNRGYSNANQSYQTKQYSQNNNRNSTNSQGNKSAENKSATNNIQGLICSDCGVGITQGVKEVSRNKHGRSLCVNCQKKQ